jgi:hypothetical protein
MRSAKSSLNNSVHDFSESFLASVNLENYLSKRTGAASIIKRPKQKPMEPDLQRDGHDGSTGRSKQIMIQFSPTAKEFVPDVRFQNELQEQEDDAL